MLLRRLDRFATLELSLYHDRVMLKNLARMRIDRLSVLLLVEELVWHHVLRAHILNVEFLNWLDSKV